MPHTEGKCASENGKPGCLCRCEICIDSDNKRCICKSCSCQSVQSQGALK